MKNEQPITENTNNKFVIDFFELAFLTEVCLPQSTIARHCFFMNVIDIHYHKMTWEQRKHLYEWIGRKLNMEHEESMIFMARFNPDNQYVVTFNNEGKKQECEAFLFRNEYKISSNSRVNQDYIESVKKIQF
jgi:hypothetical protein